MRDEANRPRRQQSGFTLVALMVGVAISLVVVLAATSLVQHLMASQRQAIGSALSSSNAILALQAVKYEAAEAGLGFSVGGYLPCSAMNLSIGGAVISNAGPFLPVNASLVGNASSTLTLVYGTSLEAATPVFTRSNQLSTDTTIEIASYLPVSAGDMVMLAHPVGESGTCTVRTVTGVVAPTGSAQGYALQFDNTGQNNQAAFGVVVSYQGSSQVLKLGQLRKSVFSLNASNDLVMSRPFDIGSPQVTLAHDIVAFMTQYGATDGLTTSLQAWQAPTGLWAVPTALQISRVRALKIGVIARSSQKQKFDLNGLCDATTVQPVLMGTTLALMGDWQCYKYRALSAIVPLRNIALGMGV